MKNQVTTAKESIKCEFWNEDSILSTLQHELMELKEKIESARKREDYGTYKNLILAFKEVIHLIHEEEEKTEWKDMSSKYKTDGKDMISLWEQKGKDIRNVKEYEVINKPYITIKLDENYTIDGDTLIIPVKVNDKDCNIYGKRIDNEWVLPSGDTIKCN